MAEALLLLLLLLFPVATRKSKLCHGGKSRQEFFVIEIKPSTAESFGMAFQHTWHDTHTLQNACGAKTAGETMTLSMYTYTYTVRNDEFLETSKQVPYLNYS
jgi:hypothetical protein